MNNSGGGHPLRNDEDDNPPIEPGTSQSNNSVPQRPAETGANQQHPNAPNLEEAFDPVSSSSAAEGSSKGYLGASSSNRRESDLNHPSDFFIEDIVAPSDAVGGHQELISDPGEELAPSSSNIHFPPQSYNSQIGVVPGAGGSSSQVPFASSSDIVPLEPESNQGNIEEFVSSTTSQFAHHQVEPFAPIAAVENRPEVSTTSGEELPAYNQPAPVAQPCSSSSIAQQQQQGVHPSDPTKFLVDPVIAIRYQI